MAFSLRCLVGRRQSGQALNKVRATIRCRASAAVHGTVLARSMPA